MFKNLLFRWTSLKQIQKPGLQQTADFKRFHINQQRRELSVSVKCYKKRKSVEERAVENTGRRVLRYSKANSDVIGIWRNMTVREIAQVLDKDLDHVYKALEFADKNSDTQYKEDTVVLNPQVIRDVVKISGYRFKFVARPDEEVEEEQNRDAVPAPPADESLLRPRPAVACVMGHVDHGKTTLLDALRDSNVVENEFGGITQHIGAFQVRLPSGEVVTFLDTPGHAAFSAMRMRGATATDVVVLVVAADDGVMEQTRQSIRMAREANVPILVAINKIDKPGVDIERTLRLLATEGVVCEAVGGDTQAVPISALKRTNLDALLDALVLQAQMMDLKADYAGFVEGIVLEAQVDPHAGKQATVLVQRGTLRRGCVLVAGTAWAKVRVLRTAEGQVVSEAPPGTPVAVLGWRELPSAGDQVLEVKSEKRANEVMKWRQSQRMKEKQVQDSASIEAKEASHREAYQQQLKRKRALGRFKIRPDGPRQKMIQDDDHPALRIVIKGDVDGSVEAILDLLETYQDHDKVRLQLVHFAVGPVAPNDVEIAEAFKATIFAFNVTCPPNVAAEAKQRGVEVKRHNVIYKLVDEIKQEISDRMPLRHVEEIIGEANVLQQFWVSEGRRKVPVAGARCVKGQLIRDGRYRLIRNGQVIYDGTLASMKHLKNEVSVIKRDIECGLRLADVEAKADVNVQPEAQAQAKAKAGEGKGTDKLEPPLPQPGDTLVCYTIKQERDTTQWDPGF